MAVDLIASHRKMLAANISARVAELADAQDLGSCGATRAGSTPASRIWRPAKEFRSLARIERLVKRGGLTPAEVEEFWDCLFLTLRQIDELLRYVKANARHPFIYPMLVFAAHTGARRSEMIRSQIDDIDFESGTVIIREKKRVRGKLSTRRGPLSPLLAEVMRCWLSKHPGGSSTFCQELGNPRCRKERTDYGPLTMHEAHDHFKRTLARSK